MAGERPLIMEKLDSVMKDYGYEKRALIPILQDLQTEYGWLSEDLLKQVSENLKIPSMDVYSVVTFYKSFRLKPIGKYFITVCLGTACHVREAPGVLADIQRKIGIENGETSPDNLFTLETVNCVGACALGPIVIVNNEYHGLMNKTKVDQLIEGLYETGQ
jgi:NADH:ubiquinone oxidoreductase subunit E